MGQLLPAATPLPAVTAAPSSQCPPLSPTVGSEMSQGHSSPPGTTLGLHTPPTARLTVAKWQKEQVSISRGTINTTWPEQTSVAPSWKESHHSVLCAQGPSQSQKDKWVILLAWGLG